jgi:hypothetical protein
LESRPLSRRRGAVLAGLDLKRDIALAWPMRRDITYA